MNNTPSLRGGAALGALFLLAAPLPAFANEVSTDTGSDDILVVAQQQTQGIENAPSTRATVTADRIATTVNAVNVEDTLRYLPSLVVRKRHIGDTQAPLATRTSGLGASARSLIFADGALLSSLIGNNNTSASPRWSLVSPAEIARIDVLYGPFSAAYAGNSIGAVVNITTRLPDRLEAQASAIVNVQDFDQYGTHQILPTRQINASLGDRFGPLTLFASITHTDSRSQPLAYVTAIRPPATGPGGAGAAGGFSDVNRTGQPIRVFGASGIEAQNQQNIKLKAALDVTSGLRLTYVGGVFLNNTGASAQSYLTSLAAGEPVYSGSVNIAGYPYAIAASAFSNGVYSLDERHWSHSLSATGTGDRFNWQIVASLYDFAKSSQRTPTTALPAARSGGAGTIVRLDGTGWETLDGKASYAFVAVVPHVLAGGAHWDRYSLNSNRYATSDWIGGREGALTLASRGNTRTVAVWVQDAITLADPLTLTLGGRYEWWRAYGGFNFSTSPALSVLQPERRAEGFSPKISLAYSPAPDWTARLSFGKAYRFPTVGELYQAITTGTVLTVPDPTLRPEQALSEELSIERRDAAGSIRVSLFTESITDALVSQSAPLVPGSATLYTYVQNVERTRARGIEIAFDRRDFPVEGIDLTGNATWTDATTRVDTAFPRAVGKRLPSVPEWKANAVVTWHPTELIALTAALRYASRNFGTLDNSDSVGNTYQGFYQYLVVDLRATVSVTDRFSVAAGIDNVNNDRYFLFHPFPQRSFTAEAHYRF